MVIRIRDIVEAAYSASQGALVYNHLRAALADESNVVVSFDGIKTVSTSFVNTAFVELLGDLNLDELKKRIRVVDSNRQINDMLRLRLLSSAREYVSP